MNPYLFFVCTDTSVAGKDDTNYYNDLHIFSSFSSNAPHLNVFIHCYRSSCENYSQSGKVNWRSIEMAGNIHGGSSVVAQDREK